MTGQGTSASFLDKKPHGRPRKTIPEQTHLVLIKTLVVEVTFVRPQPDIPLFPEETLEQNKPIKIPADPSIVIDNTTPIPKPGLRKQLTVEKNLGAIDINIDTPTYPPYSPQLQGNMFQRNTVEPRYKNTIGTPKP
jgi:hypothetical protein